MFDFGCENNAFVVQTENNKKSVNYRIWEGKRRDHKIQAKNKLRWVSGTTLQRSSDEAARRFIWLVSSSGETRMKED